MPSPLPRCWWRACSFVVCVCSTVSCIIVDLCNSWLVPDKSWIRSWTKYWPADDDCCLEVVNAAWNDVKQSTAMNHFHAGFGVSWQLWVCHDYWQWHTVPQWISLVISICGHCLGWRYGKQLTGADDGAAVSDHNCVEIMAEVAGAMKVDPNSDRDANATAKQPCTILQSMCHSASFTAVAVQW